MAKVKLARIYVARPLHSAERGTIHQMQFDGRERILVVRRNKGSISGMHYHKGISKSSNPELLFLVSGSLEVRLRDINTNQKETFSIGPNTLLEIQPRIYHEFRALEECIFIEFGFAGEGQEEHEADTVREGQPQ